jgi:hypothetical protein
MRWKDVPGYEHQYEVSEDGLVRNWETWKVLKSRKARDGSYLVNLSSRGVKRTFMVHKLVATVFVPNPEGLRFIKHKNGDKKNNSASNLYWSSTKQKVKPKVQKEIIVYDEYCNC